MKKSFSKYKESIGMTEDDLLLPIKVEEDDLLSPVEFGEELLRSPVKGMTRHSASVVRIYKDEVPQEIVEGQYEIYDGKKWVNLNEWIISGAF